MVARSMPVPVGVWHGHRCVCIAEVEPGPMPSVVEGPGVARLGQQGRRECVELRVVRALSSHWSSSHLSTGASRKLGRLRYAGDHAP